MTIAIRGEAVQEAKIVENDWLLGSIFHEERAA